MSRKPRLDLPGYHHIIDRGVNRSDIFEGDEDYETFLKIVCKACRTYRVVLHDYYLMSNYFHLLVETQMDNLSSFMKHINSNYAIYFNKKTKRSGHLWQGRFYSRYINSKEYYYTLGAVVTHQATPIPCSLKSKLIEEPNYKNIQDIIGVKLDTKSMKLLGEIEKQKVIAKKNKNIPVYSKELQEHFKEINTKADRNVAIVSAIEDGYTQAEIAKYLKMLRSNVSKIVKSVFSTLDPK